MSLRRIILGAALAGFSAIALNAMADAANTQDAAANATATSQQTAQATDQAAAPAKKAKHHRNLAKLDLNSADAAALAKVHGIGEKKAQAIVSYRDQNGAYKSVDDLKNLKAENGKPLFTEKQLAHLQNRLMVSNATAAADSNMTGNAKDQAKSAS